MLPASSNLHNAFVFQRCVCACERERPALVNMIASQTLNLGRFANRVAIAVTQLTLLAATPRKDVASVRECERVLFASLDVDD